MSHPPIASRLVPAFGFQRRVYEFEYGVYQAESKWMQNRADGPLSRIKHHVTLISEECRIEWPKASLGKSCRDA